eukprot:TRINITY_DN3442_c0_g2_i1.p1 TRINITY_DN3442_c0_g2~~TRINITY_DN3442_c0_g2_i1.p1  ORF type:complete len:157 (-),score=31.88 TRINITY_DN3442_c0_g2_i1:12-440(-)
MAASASTDRLVSSLASLSLGTSPSSHGDLKSYLSLSYSRPSSFRSIVLSSPGRVQTAPQTLHIRAARVAGVEIPNTKRIETSLTYIHGVGKTTARQVLLDLGMENKLTKTLTEEELTALRDEVSKYMTEGDLVSHSVPFLNR